MASYQPSEAEWKTYGTMFAASRFGSRLLGVALWGIQTFMVVSGISTFFKLSKERRKGHLRFLLFSTAILAVTSLDLGLDIWIVFRNLFQGGPNPRSYVEAFRADDANESLRRPQIVATALSDRNNHSFRSSYGKLWTGVAMASRPSFCGMCWVFWMLTSKTAYPAEFSAIAESLSVFVNVTVTGLILFELRTSCSAMYRAYPHRKRPSMYTTTAARMVESAAPLTFFGIIYVTVTALTYYRRPEIFGRRGTLNSISEVSASLYYSFSLPRNGARVFGEGRGPHVEVNTGLGNELVVKCGFECHPSAVHHHRFERNLVALPAMTPVEGAICMGGPVTPWQAVKPTKGEATQGWSKTVKYGERLEGEGGSAPRFFEDGKVDMLLMLGGGPFMPFSPNFNPNYDY
ncbi:hypothetical protein BKA70DRAFT_1219465 [Coprinopsis sp. MPI-PUGE-AT-0042]|nr:hypothetical protein BKA70DRAFT_1219465 [Coprinopsis sp. MPI-PUGE-AT-0042]